MMNFRIGSAGTFLLVLLVVCAEGFIGGSATIAWTPSTAFAAGVIVGAYAMLAGVVLWKESKSRLGWR